MKNCIICNESKPLTSYYKHRKMADGHLGKCKDCCKKQSKKREKGLRKKPEWVEKEKERHREKYHRLNYKEKHKPTPERKKEINDKYRNTHPEKYKAKIYSQRMKKIDKNNHLHHWSYDKDYYKDVIELNVESHNKIHRFMKYDKKTFMYKDLNGNLLNSRKKHENYIFKVITHF